MILRTARVRLRELVPEDAPFILTLLNDPAFIAHIGDRGVRSIPDAEAYIERGPRASYAQHGHGLWLVELQDPVTPIGICGILRRDALPDPDLGFAFLPAFRSRGYAFEAAAAARDFARDALRLPRLLAIVSPANASSIRLLERLGFTCAQPVVMPDAAHEVHVFTLTL